MRYVPIDAVRDAGGIGFGVTRAVVFADAVAIEFHYRDIDGRHGWHGLDFELNDAATSRRLRPGGGGCTVRDDSAHGEQWWEDVRGDTRLRLHTASAAEVMVDLTADVPVDTGIEVRVVADRRTPPGNPSRSPRVPAVVRRFVRTRQGGSTSFRSTLKGRRSRRWRLSNGARWLSSSPAISPTTTTTRASHRRRGTSSSTANTSTAASTSCSLTAALPGTCMVSSALSPPESNPWALSSASPRPRAAHYHRG